MWWCLCVIWGKPRSPENDSLSVECVWKHSVWELKCFICIRYTTESVKTYKTLQKTPLVSILWFLPEREKIKRAANLFCWVVLFLQLMWADCSGRSISLPKMPLSQKSYHHKGTSSVPVVSTFCYLNKRSNQSFMLEKWHVSSLS